MNRFLHSLLILAMMGMIACTSPNLAYFKDVPEGKIYSPTPVGEQKVAIGDRLSILVSSRDQQLAHIFNLQVFAHYNANTESFSNQRVGRYHVQEDGCIDFPVLGRLDVLGKTSDEIARMIKDKLVSSEMLKDAIVSVELLNQYYSVQGEVSRPGRFAFEEDRVTILDALSKAGDLTMYGQRDNVLVVRLIGDKYQTYRVDLTDAEKIYSSLVFYLQKDDMVYVTPNSRRAREASEFGTSFFSPSLWISAASFLTTICMLIFK